MKKVFFICITAFAVFSCSNDETEEASASKIESVLNIKDEDEQRLAYGLLDENEKLNLWDSKLKTTLENGELSNNQKELIEDLRKNLKSSLFSDFKNDEKEYFKTIYVNNFLARAKKIFTYEQMTSIFYSLGHSKFEKKNLKWQKRKPVIAIRTRFLDVGQVVLEKHVKNPLMILMIADFFGLIHVTVFAN